MFYQSHGLYKMVLLTKIQQMAIDAYVEKYGGVKIHESDLMVELISEREISSYWLKKFLEHFREVVISSQEERLVIALFRDEIKH